MNPRRRSAVLSLEPAGSRVPAAVAFHGVRWAPLLGLAMLCYVLYPAGRGFDAPVLELGEVSPAEVLAPFEYSVRKSAAELTREGDALAATVRPIYEFRASVPDSVRTRIARLFQALDTTTTVESVVAVGGRFGLRITAEEAPYLATAGRRAALRAGVSRLVQRYLVQGVPASSTIENELSREIVIRRDGRERVVARDSVLSYTQFLGRRIESRDDASSLADQIFLKTLNAVFQPTLVPNASETEALRAELRASVDPVKDVVRANERVVNAHEVVTPDIRDRLLALRAELLRRGGFGEASGRRIAGQVLANALVLSIFWLLLMLYRRETYAQLRQVMALSTLFGLVVVLAAINHHFLNEGPELIPIPFAAMLITVLFSGRVSMVAATVLAVLLGSQLAYTGPGALYLPLAGGVAGALSVRVIRSRSQLLSAGLIVTGAFLLASVIVAMRAGWPLNELLASVGRGAATAIVSAAFVAFALPVFETFTGVTTDMTLLELSDPSRPLLRRLATEAPGTYAHSIAMANLCESTCNAIGANGLLARVGCYYHDIGKLKRPLFFVENQTAGINPHDKLKPDVSASIIRNHVRDGLALADEHGLPDIVAAFIPEHHGTAEIAYFLDRARSGGVDPDAEPERYRYPGPPPRSVETAVAMLADGVEAALRVIDDASPQKLRDAIEHLIQQRVESGQLREAPLTLAQLDRVKDEFVRILTGMHHHRIDYPASSGGISAEWEAASGA